MKEILKKSVRALILAAHCLLIGVASAPAAGGLAAASSETSPCVRAASTAPSLGTRIPLTQAEQDLVMSLKPGQTVEKRIIIAPDQASGTKNCCKEGDCCCTCQCDPLPCICTCTDEIVIE